MLHKTLIKFCNFFPAVGKLENPPNQKFNINLVNSNYVWHFMNGTKIFVHTLIYLWNNHLVWSDIQYIVSYDYQTCETINRDSFRRNLEQTSVSYTCENLLCNKTLTCLKNDRSSIKLRLVTLSAMKHYALKEIFKSFYTIHNFYHNIWSTADKCAHMEIYKRKVSFALVINVFSTGISLSPISLCIFNLAFLFKSYFITIAST